VCGLVGWFGPSGNEPGEDAIRAAALTLAKRGPDSDGAWRDAGIVLAHRRLAVLDVSAAGAQPMASGSGRYVIVHNGEVYNFREVRDSIAGPGYRWRSESDTEVIVEAYERWGAACLQRLNGMFAFAIYDRKSGELFVARDRLGVKPLYYSWDARTCRFSFASRPRAILALHPGAHGLSGEALRSYAEAGFISAPRAIYADVCKLPPGHYALVSRERLQVTRYWDLRSPESAAPLGRSENELLEELDELTDRSVQRRLISDVPLGAFLSGGLDSALVVAKMAKFSRGPVKAFTIGFDAPGLDESAAAATIARHLGVEHTVERLTTADLLALLDPFFEEFDEPFADSSAFPTMAVARLARRSVTVSLSGDGGDELFAGYHYHRLARDIAYAMRVPRPIRLAAARVLRGLGHRGALLAGALREPTLVRAYAYCRGVQKDFSAALDWPGNSGESHADYLQRLSLSLADARDPVRLAAELDLKSILPDDYLPKVDGATMAYSLEAREPWLDVHLVEWAAALGSGWKLRRGQSKYLWRRLAQRYLPPDIVNAGKRGFEVPLADWLRGPLQGWARDRLSDPLLYHTLPLKRAAVDRIFADHLSGRRNAHPFLWMLIVLSEFLVRRAADPKPA
jgi:asparagine synthase (glutamine-hydrolysing)